MAHFKKGCVLLFYDTHFVKVNFNPVITVGMVHIAVYHALPPVSERISSQVASARLPYAFFEQICCTKRSTADEVDVSILPTFSNSQNNRLSTKVQAGKRSL